MGTEIIKHTVHTYQLTGTKLLNSQPLLSVVDCVRKGKNGVFGVTQGFQKYNFLPKNKSLL